MKEKSQEKKWTQKKEWWLDLLKFGITFTVGAIVTVAIVNRIEEARAKSWSYTQVNDQLRLTALEDFRKNTFRYNEASEDAYVDLYQWKGPTKTTSMIRYEQEAHEELQISVEELLRRFEDVANLKEQITALNLVNDQRHDIYDNVKDTMKSTGQYGPDLPTKQRLQFDELRKQFGELRSKVMRV